MLELNRNSTADRDPRAECWIVVLVAAFAMVIGLRVSGMTVPPLSMISTTVFLISSGMLAYRQNKIDQLWLRRLIDFFEVFALLGAMSLVGCIGSYLIASQTHGYQDALLAGVDSKLGLDWRVAYALTAHSSVIQIIGRNAYSVVIQLPLLLVTMLCATGQARLARRYVVAFGISLTLTMVFFAFAPAAGPIDYFPIEQGSYLPQTGHFQVETIDFLRSGGMTHIDMAKLNGIVSYPSFHASAGILLLWISAWFGTLRWPLRTVTLLMLAATPVEGNHYFIDLLGGALNAIVAIGLSRRCGGIRLRLNAKASHTLVFPADHTWPRRRGAAPLQILQ